MAFPGCPPRIVLHPTRPGAHWSKLRWAPVITGDITGPPGNSVFALYDFFPGSNYQNVQTFGPSGTNGNPALDGIGPAIATPEPTGSLLWAVTLCGVGGYYLRRRKVQLAESND